MNILFLFRMAEICIGLQFEIRKTFDGHKSLTLYQKVGFQGLMSELVTHSLLRKPNFMTS